MSISKVAWAVSVLSALSLGGCVLDTTAADEDNASVGAVTWDLTHEDPASGGEEGEGEDGTVDDGDDGAEGDVQLGELDGPGDDPTQRVNNTMEPHPDPWKGSKRQSEGVGNSD